MKRIASFFTSAVLAIAAAVPSQGGWAPNGVYTDNKTNQPQITNGVWTLTLYGNTRAKYKAHEGDSTVLNLTKVNDDLEAAGSSLRVSELDTGAFYQNSIVTEVYLPDYITKLGKQSFMYCEKLSTVCISANAVFVDSHVFACSPNLETIYYNGATPEVGTVQIPASVKDIKNNVFEFGGGFNNANTNRKIKKIIAPGITEIKNTAFQSCAALEYVYAPNAKRIGQYAFQHNVALDTVVISPELNYIGPCAFDNSAIATLYPSDQANPEVGTIFLPSTLTTMDNYGHFMGSRSRFTKVVARGMTSVPNRAFQNAPALVSVEFSPSLTLLDSNNTSTTDTPFYNCTKLESVYPSRFVSGFTELDTATFRNCNSLTTYFDLSDTPITAVPSMWAAYTSLDGVTFPATLAEFTGDQNFRELKKGAKFRFLGNRPTVTKTGNQSPFYTKSKNNTAQRHVFIVDAATYPSWTNGTDFVAMADINSNSDTKNAFSESSDDFPATKYPGEIEAEDVLGATIWGSGDGRYNWVVQYVNHTKYAITWMNGDVEFATTQVEIGHAPTAPDETPSKASTAEFDYTFIGWNIDPNATTALDLATLALNEATTFYAIYSSATRSYEITWKLDANTDIDTTTVLYGVVPTHADASKEADGTYSYRFDGWSTDGLTVLASLPAVTGAATYIAVFTPLSLDTSVTVSWFDEDGTTPLDPATTTVEKGAKPTHAEPAKAATVDTAYTFAGWTQVGGDGTVVYTTADLPAASANVSYMAVYSSATRQYTVTFANWDGTIVTETLYDYNTPATAVVVPECPLRPATAEYTYAFTGWSPAAVADVVSDATYTAQYSSTPNEYTAIFVNGQTEETVSSVALAYGSAVTAPEPPEVDGYTFVKWSPAVDTMPPANTTYTAIYTINKYTITWKNANGATLGTTTVEHGAMPAYGGTAPSLSNTSKLGYTFTGWTPEIVAATEATTYTAAYTVTFLSPMTIALDGAAYDKGSGEATVVTKVGNTDAAATTTAEATAQFKTTSVTGEATVDGTTVTSVFDNFASGRGYEWTITATQTYGAEYSGASESASIKGRTYARAAKSWFDNEAVAWNEGAFAPAAQSGSGAQVRLRAKVTFPAVLPRVRPEAGSAVVGITAYQPNAGVAPRYYAWNGSQWVKLVGVAPKGGVAVNLLGVVDFARKDGPAVAWYADGFQLTTEEGDWEVPLAGGTKLTSFGLVGDLAVGSLSGDYDVGGLGFTLLVR